VLCIVVHGDGHILSGYHQGHFALCLSPALFPLPDSATYSASIQQKIVHIYKSNEGRPVAKSPVAILLGWQAFSPLIYLHATASVLPMT
jgi:hypothetical protein